MQMIESRRRFLATLAAGAAGLVGAPAAMTRHSFAEDGPLETATFRIRNSPVICNAPQDIADGLLRQEGFTDVQYVSVSGSPQEALVRGELDLNMLYTPPAIVAVDSGAPITMLAGVHVGCNVVFAQEGIRSIRDLKGKKVGGGAVANPLLASMAAYVGLDPRKDI
jgi:NitT/TauT family transport system substrate-binding protein